jgi:cytochrome c oxidase subunit 3
MSLPKNIRKQKHPFHLVTPSPWPIATSFSILSLATSLVIYFHYWRDLGLYKIYISFFLLAFCLYRWFSDVITEATFEGNHTKKVRQGLRYGMLLFIISEIMFFFSFFWAFFHSSLNPSIYIGAVWPPYGLQVLNPWGLPFLNTLILLYSGLSITWAHRAIIAGLYNKTTIGLGITIGAGILFTMLQAKEYVEAPFSINDSIYGSVFFLATGFHGFHVIIGTIFLFVCFLRHLNFHFTREHHFGFEAAAWYWHFVDVVWIFLFLTIYIWGS